jgi:hypothetical protein
MQRSCGDLKGLVFAARLGLASGKRVITQRRSSLVPGSGSGAVRDEMGGRVAVPLPVLGLTCVATADRGPPTGREAPDPRIAWLRVMRGHRYADGAATTAVP